MKTRRPNDQHAQQPTQHAPQIAPVFRSPVTGHAMANLLAEQRAAVDHHGEQATRARQDAEEQLRHIASREEMIAEKQREIDSIRTEIERIQTAAQNANTTADQHSKSQEQAALAVQDLETVLGVYAPAALELPAPANGTPPGGTPATTTGGYDVPVAGNGTGPQQVPTHAEIRKAH